MDLIFEWALVATVFIFNKLYREKTRLKNKMMKYQYKISEII